MNGSILETNAPADAVKTAVETRALKAGYKVNSGKGLTLQVGKGNLVASIFVGAFIAYCNFVATISESAGTTRLHIVRNTPWWTGLIGVKRVKTRCHELGGQVAEELESQGFNITSRVDT